MNCGTIYPLTMVTSPTDTTSLTMVTSHNGHLTYRHNFWQADSRLTFSYISSLTFPCLSYQFFISVSSQASLSFSSCCHRTTTTTTILMNFYLETHVYYEIQPNLFHFCHVWNSVLCHYISWDRTEPVMTHDLITTWQSVMTDDSIIYSLLFVF